ncbi:MULTISPECIES: 3-mercaptopyruvate sulfurtransferase [unclassified Burkholderia]|uniref:3-mercaptopyruvate sulfurtransferase n=1 Tax=unclassified Burkholderia TaxID=2613784 RepID=UPI002AB01380|nr:MULTISPECIES: 3-mercaptopyruvate sulfurtransferase [unclassified Burkholderia]
MEYPGPVVSASWLHERLGKSNIVIVDASVHLPDTGRVAREEYVQEHIPGALFFDLDEIADPDNPLPRKVPSAELFAERVGNLGIDNETHVVAYDTPGLYSAARVWWLFRLYGYDRVSILDGGMKAWKADGYSVESGSCSATAKKFHVPEARPLLARWDDVLRTSQSKDEQLIDARTPGRFSGTEQDRYPGTRPGHIPRSLNLYWADLLDNSTRKLLSADEIRMKFTQSGITWNHPVTVTCGSGLTACILALGLTVAGMNEWRVYDGSWDEWGRRHDLPIESAVG